MKNKTLLFTLHPLLFTLHPLLFTLPLLLFPSTTLSQPAQFSDCHQLQAVTFLKGEILSINCDTAYVLNALTFRRYDSAYKDLRRKSAGIANLMNTYDEIIALQEKRIREQEETYALLRESFGRLSEETQSQIGESAQRLHRAAESMELLTRDLTETKKLLVEAKEIVKAERHGLNLESVLWGAGGLIVGLVVAAVMN